MPCRRLREARLPYIVVLTDPTTGGVTASYAMLGDVHIAEPGALICFAGPRVIQQTIREQLPEGFQKAEYLLAHGMIDMVVHRHQLRETLSRLCRLLTGNAAAARAAQADAPPRTTAISTAASVDGTTIETLARILRRRAGRRAARRRASATRRARPPATPTSPAPSPVR